MKCQAVCFKQRACSIQIFNLPALQVDHEEVKKMKSWKSYKKIPTQRLKKKKKKERKKKKRWSSFKLTAPKETPQDCAWLAVLSGIREMSWL